MSLFPFNFNVWLFSPALLSSLLFPSIKKNISLTLFQCKHFDFPIRKAKEPSGTCMMAADSVRVLIYIHLVLFPVFVLSSSLTQRARSGPSWRVKVKGTSMKVIICTCWLDHSTFHTSHSFSSFWAVTLWLLPQSSFCLDLFLYPKGKP